MTDIKNQQCVEDRRCVEDRQPLPLAITMGCPVGIGPEIVLKLYDHLGRRCAMVPVVVGDPRVLEATARLLGLESNIVIWRPGAVIEPGTVPVWPLSSLDYRRLKWGQPDRETGRAMGMYVQETVRAIQQGVFSGLVTCPISKSALQLGGYPYPGHTEMLADLTGTDRFLMMMAGSRLKVVLVTIHEPLARVAGQITRERVENCIRLTVSALEKDFGVCRPRIAIAGLNPHAGEDGMFGLEEETVLGPVIESLNRSGGCLVSGPWPPDTVFYRGARGEWDAVVAMYHDQGLIPFKLLHFHDGVNVTLGLPIVRTSVDHGTAYDIAGRGVADPSSLEAAWKMAAEIVRNRADHENKGMGLS
ncbi:4-hydroxythreonine-4-phosphate dehydrogenase PdxA [Desulfolithobacter sp.]